ncbi:MAG: flagellar biosynthesis protein FlhB [Armatimonadetes bacterium]|nr:flagellar biosynthesis protein FlhB [Armatimonadota bacterium]
MAEESSQERTEDATPRRRSQARKKGTVAKSQDLTSASVVFTATMVAPSAFGMLHNGFSRAFAMSLAAQSDLTTNTLRDLVINIMMLSLPGLALLIGSCMVVGIAVNLAQVGFVFSGEALTPSFAKLNPLNGLKRLFSFTAGFEGIKALLKSFLFGLVLWGAMRNSWNELAGLGAMTTVAALSVIGSLLHSIAIRISLIWLILAAVDYFVQRRQVNKQLKMTKYEVRQEYKEMETSPELKMAMSRRRQQLKKMRTADAVESANVIVTNPTHYAVALRYDPEKHGAPEVVAKGVDFMAAKIREFATEYGVPIVPNPPLARALYRQCDIGDYVPRELFQAVAEVLAYVYQVLKAPQARR